jgi:hypothetical protein
MNPRELAGAKQNEGSRAFRYVSVAWQNRRQKK